MSMRINRAGRVISAVMRKEAYKQGVPVHAMFELTPRCGFGCRMCYVHLAPERIQNVGRGRELTAREWLNLGRQAGENGVFSLCITGGDPIMHPDFPAIWRGLAQMGFRLILQTNAAFLTEEHLELFAAYPPDTVKITIYGASDATYERLCRVPNGFTRAMAGTYALRALDLPIQMVTTFVKQNWADRDRIAELMTREQLPWYYSTACYASLRGAQNEAASCALSESDIACVRKPEADQPTQTAHNPERSPAEYCRGYRTEFMISWDGYMRFCSFLDEPHISVLDAPLMQCWEELLDFWSSLRWPKACESCEAAERCRRCLGMLACASGGLGKVSPDFCRQFQKK